jgi:hypothetical protein
MKRKLIVLVFCLIFTSCTKAQIAIPSVTPTIESVKKITNNARVIHVLVALCDNEFQGIVPVLAHLGNGEDTAKNLYWGAMYGVKSYSANRQIGRKLPQSRSRKKMFWKGLSSNTKPKTFILWRMLIAEVK